MPYKDYTLKARLPNFTAVERKLEQLGANFVGLDQQLDTYFETTKGKLKLRQGTIETLIAHYERRQLKGIERTHIYRYDRNPSPTQIRDFIAGNNQIGSVRKARKIYQLQNIKIHLDEIEKRECFIEIEAIDEFDEFSETDLKKQCLDMKSQLGIPDDQLIKSGYLNF